MRTSPLRPVLPFLSAIYAGLLLSVFSPASSQDPQPLTRDDFDLLHSAVQPDASELWRQIPWGISLLEGQQRAVEEGKPIFLWAMDGHPLGCT
ncbi:MAG: hypothetical protein P1U87_01860 [Verrucomicrobiales bacterium]|nr:hypothetical protein [Verrucomicrobiales bacterium]